MSFKKTIIWAVILAGIIGVYYLQKDLAEKKEKEELKAKELTEIHEKNITRVELITPRERIVVAKDETKRVGFNIVEPIETVADTEAVYRLVRAVIDRDWDKVVAEKTDDLTQFGLDKPYITFTVKTEKKSLTILIGDDTPVGYSVYAMIKGKSEVITVSRGMKSDLDKTVFDIRERTLVPFRKDEVGRFRLSIKETEIAAEKDNEGKWRLTSPLFSPADEEQIVSFLDEWEKGRIKAFVSEHPKSLAPYGLEKPRGQLSLFIGEGLAEQRLLIGKINEEGTGYYARRTSGDTVFVIPKQLIEDIPLADYDWREKHLFSFDQEKVTRIEVETGVERTIIEKKGEDEWELTSPIKTNGDNWEISGLISTARFSRVKKFIDEPEEGDAYGFEKPTASISIKLEEEKEPLTLLIGGKSEKPEGYYARTNKSQLVYILEKEDGERFVKTSFDLRDKVIFSYKHENLSRIELTLGERKAVIKKKGEGFTVVEPKSLKGKRTEAEDVVWVLDTIKLRKIVEEKPADLSRYGLSKPKAKVKALLKKEELPELIIGAEAVAGDKVYARLSDSPVVYQIDYSIYDNIKKIFAEGE
jgi:hypothetical protein